MDISDARIISDSIIKNDDSTISLIHKIRRR